MAERTFQNLIRLREDLVGLSLAGAAEASGLSKARLREIESGEEASVFELDRIAEAYGVDADALFDRPIRVQASDGISMLASMDEYRELTDWTRARIVRAANAARDLKTLRQCLGRTASPLPSFGQLDPRDTPFQQGDALATAVRRFLGLGLEPINSMRDVVLRRLPEVGLLYARLGNQRLAGLGFADDRRGPAVVLNLQGRNENPAVRRFSLAHELCHLLVDWNHTEPLTSVSGFLGEDEHALVREQRANAFAIRLLCPETVARQLSRYTDADAVHELCVRYGVHYGAARLYLRNTTTIRLDPTPPPGLDRLLSADAWRDAESPVGLEGFPEAAVPEERRGTVAREASLAYSKGLISRARFAGFLGVTTGHALDEVLGYFGMDAPSEDSDSEDALSA